ncbi:hypothetical protein TNCV_908661 [Trichonephila clavipes]|nr:hypothetical protein TNCV_908661 [Trichonephila clavipes]
MGKRSEASRDGNGVSRVDQSMREYPHAQKRAEALPIHVAVQFQRVWYPKKSSKKEALQLGRRTQGRCEGLGHGHINLRNKVR